jgi:hypothetical protein
MVLVIGTETGLEVSQEGAVTVVIPFAELKPNTAYVVAVRDAKGALFPANTTAALRPGENVSFKVETPGGAPEDFEISQNAQGGVTITKYIGKKKNVVIPATLYGVKVTAIGDEAFLGTNIAGVVIPDTVTEIGSRAFGWKMYDESRIAGSLTSVTLGNRLQTIGYDAFTNNNISELILPASLKVIGDAAFVSNNIKSLTIPNGVTAIGSGAFGPAGPYGDDKPNPIETLVIPPSLAKYVETRTADRMGIFGSFRDCPLTRITLPANLDERNLAGFDESFVNFWKSQGKKAGTYVKNGPVWTVR